MASITVSTSDTASKNLSGGGTLTVTATGTLKPGGPAVRWNLGTSGLVTIDNSGSIAPTSGRAIDTTGSAGAATSLSIVNHSGATISAVSDLIRIQSSLHGGSIDIDNEGALAGGSGRGINVQEYDGLSSFTLTNHAGATFTSTGDVVRITSQADTPPAFTGTITIDNGGTIRSTGTGDNNGQALDLNDVAATTSGQIHVINRAGGVLEAADADAVRSGANSVIDNYGTIQSHNGLPDSSGNDAIDAQSSTGITVNNYQGGEIIGARHGITGDNPVAVTNDGAITGQQGAGVNLDTPADSVTTIVNNVHGVITGTATAHTDGDGIDVDGLVDITNHGTIQAVGIYEDGLNEALAIGGGTVVNDGLITSTQRAITVDDSDLGPAFDALHLTNSGTITGQNGEAIDIAGAAADTIDNSGVINGSISTGGGNDTITLSGSGQVNGIIDGGDGHDTLVLSGKHDGFDGSLGAGGVVTITDTDATNGDLGTIVAADVEHFVFDDLSVDFASAAGGALTGGAGTDWLIGNSGNDRLTGGAGGDLFIFDNLHSTGHDTITDFGASDLLLTSAKIFDSNNDGIITFGGDRTLDLFTDGSDVAITSDAGRAITKLGYEGTITIDGETFYAYGLANASGADAYHYHSDFVTF